MKMKMKSMVFMAKRYKSDDGNYSATTLYCQGEMIDESNPDSAGQEIVKVRGDYDSFKAFEGLLPCEMELEVYMAQGAKDKAELRFSSAKPLQPPKTAA